MKIDPSGSIEAGEEIEKAVGDLMKTGYGDVAQPLLKSIGKTLALAWEAAIETPIRHWSEKRKALFAARLRKYLEQIAQIEEEHLCGVPPEIGCPLLERLSYVQDDYIAEKFVSLLTTASSDETINQAHPRFVSLIDSISPDEANILDCIADKKKLRMPFVMAGRLLGIHLTGLEQQISLHFPENIELYLSNLVSLAVLNIEEDIHAWSPAFDDLCKLYRYSRADIPELPIDSAQQLRATSSLRVTVFVVAQALSRR